MDKLFKMDPYIFEFFEHNKIKSFFYFLNRLRKTFIYEYTHNGYCGRYPRVLHIGKK